jgi:hypothetical protein
MIADMQRGLTKKYIFHDFPYFVLSRNYGSNVQSIGGTRINRKLKKMGPIGA